MEWIMRERVDLAHPQGQHVWPDALMIPGDSYAHRWMVSVCQDGEPVDLSDWTIYGYITRCRDDVLVPIKGEASGCEASVLFEPACYAVRGELYGVMQAVKGEVRLTLACGRWRLSREHGANVIDPSELLPSLPELLAEIENMREATAACEAATEAAAGGTNAPAIVSEASGGLVSIADGAARAAQGMTSTIAAVQAGSGDPGTDNVRALSGWDAVSVTRTGRNLLSHLDYVTTNGHNATIITADVIDVTSPTTYDYGNISIRLKAGVTYTLVIDWEVYGRDESSTLVTRFSSRMDILESSNNYMNAYANSVMRSVKTYTPDADVATKLMLHPNYGSGLAACSRTRVMLLVGAYTTDTAPAFVPCERQVISVALPETIWGGRLDWVNGLLTVTHGQIASYAGETVADGWVSSTGELSTGAQVVYPLETPCTHQLDPQALTLLKGDNAVWSDCGDTAIAYIADTKLYIDNALAAIAASVINA